MWTYGSAPPATQWSLLILAALLAWHTLRGRQPWWKRGKRVLRKLAQHPLWAAATLLAVSLGINGLLTGLKYPVPAVHDEFSYLLASDTFASGRLTNPAHPLWQHFETFHVLSQPTYMSKYPPGNALFLAVGQKLTGHPIMGAWLAMALALLALFWMLRAWTTPTWALAGALLVALHEPVIRAWGQSYWGGSVAFLGGALIFGGLRRIWSSGDQPLIRDAVLTGLGFVILANTRPLEGLLVSLPVMLVLSVWYVRQRGASWRRKTLRVALPVGIIGLAGLAGIARYNQAVTGDATTMPYALHDRTYSASSLIAWKVPPAVPEYRHPWMEKFYREWGRDRQLALQDPAVYLRQLNRKLRMLWQFLPLGIGLTMLPLCWLWKDPWWRFAITIVAGILLVHSQMATSWIYPHYIAPAYALCLALNIECLRYLRTWQRTRGWGILAVRTTMLAVLLSLIPTAVTQLSSAHQPTARQQIETQLAHTGEPRHLVVLSYGSDYPIVNDWVYNRADIDASAIVWARDMGQLKNAKLFEYFADRKVWRCHLESDEVVKLQAVSSGQLYSQDSNERSWAE